MYRKKFMTMCNENVHAILLSFSLSLSHSFSHTEFSSFSLLQSDWVGKNDVMNFWSEPFHFIILYTSI